MAGSSRGGRPPVPARAAAAAQAALQQGLALHRQGKLAQARAIYETILRAQPRHFDALNLLGTLAAQTGDHLRAVDLLGRALQVNPSAAASHNNLGAALKQLGRLDEALASYDRAIALKPDNPEAHHNRGNILLALGRPQEALASYEQALALKPAALDALLARGNILKSLERFDDALASYDAALALEPGNADTHVSRGNVLKALGRPAQALDSYAQAVALRPGFAQAWNNHGNTLQQLGQPLEALASYAQALALEPGYVEAWANQGGALIELKRLDEALDSFDRALALDAGHPQAWNNRGNALLDLKRLDEALACYTRAVELDPGYAEALVNQGNVLVELNRIDDAMDSYGRAWVLKPDHEFLTGTVLHAKMKKCDWDGLAASLELLRAQIRAGKRASLPFPTLALFDDPALHKQAAMLYAPRVPAAATVDEVVRRRVGGERIRIGYYSGDFHNHPMAYLTAGVFEAHDKTRFETIGFSFGPDRADEMRLRVAGALDQFIDVRNKSDAEVVALSRELGIDIAVDLCGYTQNARPQVFAGRCAPIQVTYLGYPGTTGAACFDYVIADPTVIPAGREADFTEQVARMPVCYFPSDRRRAISPREFTRAELGLPESGFVFCCFNNNYKILPAMFDVWMRLLRRVPGSVLWLLQDNPEAARNLRKEAQARGMDSNRIVFARRRPMDEHLARHRQADLFIDTLPYNAHTTASDALWAGLPLLTCTGQSFASRVAASLLGAVGLPELVTHTLEDYEELAVALATDPERLRATRAKLQANRLVTPLFDAPRFAKDLEALYGEMGRRRRDGTPVG